MSHNTRVFIAEDDAELERLIRQAAAEANVTAAEFRASLVNAVVGTPGRCAEQIQSYVDAE